MGIAKSPIREIWWWGSPSIVLVAVAPATSGYGYRERSPSKLPFWAMDSNIVVSKLT